MINGPEEVAAYLAALPHNQRAALSDLRTRLRTLLPDQVECLSHAMPGFRQPGTKHRMVAGYAAFSRYLGLYPIPDRSSPGSTAPPSRLRSPAFFSPRTARCLIISCV